MVYILRCMLYDVCCVSCAKGCILYVVCCMLCVDVICYVCLMCVGSCMLAVE